MAIIQNHLTNGRIIVNIEEQRDMRSYLRNYRCKSCLILKQRDIRSFRKLFLMPEIQEDNNNVGNR